MKNSSLDCNCRLAAAIGRSSCLDSLNPLQRDTFFHEAHGPPTAHWPKSQVLIEHHKKIWVMKESLPKADSYNRMYRVPRWMLGDVQVCAKSWTRAYCYSKTAQRSNLALTLRGVGPAAEGGRVLAAKAVKSFKRMKAGKQEWATRWWVNELLLHDWLPNECAIQIRGASWEIVFNERYLPLAKMVEKGCCRATWMYGRPAALKELAAKYYPDRPDTCLRCKRSANHSRFPECKKCSALRKAYMRLATNPGASKASIDIAYNSLLQHNQEWGDDRAAALAMKFEAGKPMSDSIYECDDKCGSYWQSLPTDPTGRESKDQAKYVFPFSVQANVIYGQNGLQQFCITPKNVTTGSNFGLTCLMLALHRSFEIGLLTPQVKCLKRHTDGGPDNMSVVTQLFHWLLVYIGVFDEVLWFRFEAGHSHTELADRLFSICKRLFSTDSARRAQGIGCFPELWSKLQEAFKECPELNEMTWNLGNWDFREWFDRMGIEGNLTRMSAVAVYRYQYDIKHWKHGGVFVTFKKRLSYKKAHANECEFSPIINITRTEFNAYGEEEEVAANITDPNGVMFIRRPPDLRSEPKREELDTAEKYDLAKMCKSIVRKRTDDLSQKSKAFWLGMATFFDKSAAHVDQIPKLPCVTSATLPGSDQTFEYKLTGAPRDLKPMLKTMMRFPRPLITWDIFEEEPPTAFASAHTMQSDDKSQEAEQHPSGELRDPREVNEIVHDGRSLAAANRDITSIDDEHWAEDAPSRLELSEVKDGELYIIKIMNDDLEHEFHIALAQCLAKVPNSTKFKLKWFKRTSKGFKWPVNPVFKQAYDDQCEGEAFLLHVSDSMLTKDGLKNKATRPRLNGPFMKRLRLFCKVHDLIREQGEAAAGKAPAPASRGRPQARQNARRVLDDDGTDDEDDEQESVDESDSDEAGSAASESDPDESSKIDSDEGNGNASESDITRGSDANQVGEEARGNAMDCGGKVPLPALAYLLTHSSLHCTRHNDDTGKGKVLEVLRHRWLGLPTLAHALFWPTRSRSLPTTWEQWAQGPTRHG